MTVTSYTFAILKLRSSWTKVYQIFTRCGQIIVDYVFNSEWRCFKPFRNAKATNKFTAKSVSERILKINQHLTKKHKYSGTFFQTRCTVDHPSISESLSLADLGCKVGTGQIGLRRRRRRRKGGWEWEPGVLASWRHGPLPPPKSASGHCNTGSMRITRAYYRRIILILCTKSTLIWLINSISTFMSRSTKVFNWLNDGKTTDATAVTESIMWIHIGLISSRQTAICRWRANGTSSWCLVSALSMLAASAVWRLLV